MKENILEELIKTGLTSDSIQKTYERYVWAINHKDEEIEQAISEQKQLFTEDVQCQLMQMEEHYLKSPMDLQIKTSEYFGMLILAHHLKVITWDRVLSLLGEFTSKAMGLR